MEDVVDWMSHFTKWSQQSIWQATNEIANNSVRGQANNINESRFFRDADVVDEELLDELFAEDELIELL